MKRNASIILLSVLSLLLAGCSECSELKPGTEMMLGGYGALRVKEDAQIYYERFGGNDWQVSEGTKVRVIKDVPENGKTDIYVLEGDARNHVFTVDRSWLLPMTATH